MSNFNLEKSIEILDKTPSVLRSLLSELSESWINENEGENTWSPYDILGHLIHGEKTDWVIRTKIILEEKDKNFKPFDRFAMFEESKGRNIIQLLDEFEKLRQNNLKILAGLKISEKDYNKTGIHPEFGEVNLKQLLATWVVHDLGHIRQIVRVMAKQYKEDIGPWKKYLPVVEE